MSAATDEQASQGGPAIATTTDLPQLLLDYARLQEQHAKLEARIHQSEQRRRAMIHIMDDLNRANKKLGDQRKAMLHILADYEQDRSRLARQTERLDSSRRALLHILQDSHQSNIRLENSRKAMIHIMGDLSETTAEMQRREAELREKQEQLVQAAKLATLGELTTGVAHELNNPLNNIGLFIGNVIDLIELGSDEPERVLQELRSAMAQVRKATEIITHLRTFGRAAPATREAVSVNRVIEESLSLMHEQLRLRQIEVCLSLDPDLPAIRGNPIQLEQVLINLLTNARDALRDAPQKRIEITSRFEQNQAVVLVRDSGAGVAAGLERRIFDPFFTTKEVGKGTGLGLSITYGIIKEHQGTIRLVSQPGEGAVFQIELPVSDTEDFAEQEVHPVVE